MESFKVVLFTGREMDKLYTIGFTEENIQEFAKDNPDRVTEFDSEAERDEFISDYNERKHPRYGLKPWKIN